MKPVTTVAGNTVMVSEAFIIAIDTLNQFNARYMVIGGASMLLSDIDRTPRDYDIWLDTDSSNVRNIEMTFKELGRDYLGYEVHDLVRQNSVSNLIESIYTFSPHEIDFRARADGRIFADCYPNSKTTSWGCRVISMNDLLFMKETKGRDIDLTDSQMIKPHLANKEIYYASNSC